MHNLFFGHSPQPMASNGHAHGCVASEARMSCQPCHAGARVLTKSSKNGEPWPAMAISAAMASKAIIFGATPHQNASWPAMAEHDHP